MGSLTTNKKRQTAQIRTFGHKDVNI